MYRPISVRFANVKRTPKSQIGAIFKLDTNAVVREIRREQVIFNNTFGRAAQSL